MKKLWFICLLFFQCGLIAAQPASWYKQYKGKIGRHGITLHLHKAGGTYSGFYYYHRQGQPVYVNGSDTASANGEISLMSYPSGQQQSLQYFSITFSKDKISGLCREENSDIGQRVRLTQTTNTALNFSYYYTAGSVKLRSSMQESPVAEFEAASIWPNGNSNRAVRVKQAIGRWLAFKSEAQTLDSVLEESKETYFRDYFHAYDSVSEKELTEFFNAYSQTNNQYTGILYHSRQLLSLYHFRYSYTGGAHGNYGTSFIVINLQNGKTLTTDDIFTETGKRHLNKWVEKYFRIAYGLGDTASLKSSFLFDDHIAANTNFYTTAKGIGFSYMPYEIAPYAAGEIQVFIPYSDIKHLLRREFRELL